MDLKQLRHFTAIVDNGSFLAAAEAIHISQPALSRSLQNLEANLGTSLLSRSTRGLQITQAGERLYQRAKLILGEADKALAEARTQLPDNTFNVGLAPMFAGHIAPKALLELSALHPEIELTVQSGLFTDLIGDLSSGALDVIFANLPFADIADDLAVEPVLDICIVYVASAAHDLAGKAECEFSALANYPWAVVDERHANDLYRYIFTSEGRNNSPIRLKTNSLTLLKSVIAKPPYVTLLPKHMVTDDVTAGRLSILNVRQDPLRRKGGLIYRKSDQGRPPIAQLKAAIKAAAKLS